MPLDPRFSDQIIAQITDYKQNVQVKVSLAPDTKAVHTNMEDLCSLPGPSKATGFAGILYKLITAFHNLFMTLTFLAKTCFRNMSKSVMFTDLENDISEVMAEVQALQSGNMNPNGPASVSSASFMSLYMMAQAYGFSFGSALTNLAGSAISVGQTNNLGQGLSDVLKHTGHADQVSRTQAPIQDHHIVKPLNNLHRELAQAETLSLDDVKAAYSKGILSDTEMRQQLHDLGYSEQFHSALMLSNETVLPVEMVMNLYTSGTIGKEMLVDLLRRTGISKTDIVLLSTLGEKTVKQVTTQTIEDQLLSLYKSEAIEKTDLEQLLKDIGMNEHTLMDKLSHIDIAKELETFVNTVNSLIKAFSEGSITSQKMIDALVTLGVEQFKAEGIAEKTVELSQNDQTRTVHVNLNEAVEKGIIDISTYVTKMKEQGVPSEISSNQAAQLVKRDNSVINNSDISREEAQMPINLAFISGVITESDFRIMSSQIGTPQAEIDILAFNLNHETHVSTKEIPLEDIRNGYLNGALDSSSASSLLRAIGYAPNDIAILIRIWESSIEKSPTNISNTANNAGLNKSSFSIGELNRDILETWKVELIGSGLKPEDVDGIIVSIVLTLVSAGIVAKTIAQNSLHEYGVSLNSIQELLG